MSVYNSNGVKIADAGSSSGTNFDYDKIIKSINHRGYNSIAPENTLPAFKLSKEKGFNYVETDVSWTKDGYPVLCHETTVDNLSNGTGNLADKTLEELRALDFGSWKSVEYTGTQIPTFEEFIALCKNIGLHPYIEFKKGTYDDVNVKKLVDIVRDYGMLDKVTWIQFYGGGLTYVRTYDENARLGIIGSINVELAKELGGDVFFIMDSYSVTDENVETAKAENIPLEVYSIHSDAQVTAMNPYVTGMTTDTIIAGKVLYDANIN